MAPKAWSVLADFYQQNQGQEFIENWPWYFNQKWNQSLCVKCFFYDSWFL
jgi:hypothetical protein